MALIVMAFFGAYAVIGPNGVLAYGDYKRQLARREAQYAEVDKRRAVLRNHVRLLDPRNADPDFSDEMVRKNLKTVHPDEVVVPLN